MTQLEAARRGILTPEMVRVAIRENVSPEFIRHHVAAGRIVIPANRRHLAGSGGAEPSAEWRRRYEDLCHWLTQNLRGDALPQRAAQPQGDGPAEAHKRNGARAADAAWRDVLPPDFPYPTQPAGHPRFTAASALWVNQTVEQRRRWLDDPDYQRGEKAPKRLDPTGIGRPISTKINANQGASPVSSHTAEELEKLRWAILYGADTVMDLSTGGDLDACRQAIIDHSPVPVGTVPIYSMILDRDIEELDYDTILRTIEKQARQGVDYFTIHAGVLKEHLPLIKGRVMGLVSRGGSLLAKWMIHHNKQNPMYELFDEISAIMREYDVTYSLGDGVRPGCLADASDPAQLAELRVLAELVQRAREAGVQVMVEGPGHIPLHEVAFNMEIERRWCDDAPFYVLGPLVTDVFPGYDHITSAIGAAVAAQAGAAMLCYVTPKEHVGLPKAEDVKAGCIAYRIAAHAGDIARGIPGAQQWDDDLSKARAALNWPLHFELAFDGQTARALHDEDLEVDTDFCAMCGHDWCSVRISKEISDWASGKHEGYQPQRVAAKSPGVGDEGRKLLEQRRSQIRVPLTASGKPACHSSLTPDAEAARRLQRVIGES